MDNEYVHPQDMIRTQDGVGYILGAVSGIILLSSASLCHHPYAVVRSATMLRLPLQLVTLQLRQVQRFFMPPNTRASAL
jgi:hypothetical protein